MHEEILRGLRREELIAFENSFECPFCGSHENDSAFTPSEEDLLFAGWRVCRSCNRRYSQKDSEFLKVAKIEFYTPDVCAGSSEEQ
jgi:transcription elongation factor Elf1